MNLISRINGILERLGQDSSREAAADTNAVPSIILPKYICEKTIKGLRSHSPPYEDHEGVVYWAGHNLDSINAKLVTTCLVPEAETGPGFFHVPAAADAEIVHQVHQHNISGIGVVHSHPGDWISHSDGDNEGAGIVFDGFYSIVVPNYGEDGMLPLNKCGIHRFENNKFLELDDSTVETQFEVIHSPTEYIDTRK